MTNSSGTAIAFGTATATSFTNGVATVSGTGNGAMKLYKAQTALITISDGSINNGSGLSVTVGAAAAASISLTAWEQPREASRPDECFPRSDASSAGDCLGDDAIVPAVQPSRFSGLLRSRGFARLARLLALRNFRH